MNRVGIICSSGGGAFISAYKLLRDSGYAVDCTVLTDRQCGIEIHCASMDIPHARIVSACNEEFSQKACHWLYDICDVNWVCLFFTRLVSSHLFARGICINIHPSLLPAFPGMRALKDLWDSNTLHFGATSHFVDSSIDGGKIIAQVVGCVDRTKGFNIVERISFAHKVYLFLVVWELVETGRLHPSMVNYDGLKRHIWANPSIQSKKLIDNFEMFLIEENIEWTR